MNSMIDINNNFFFIYILFTIFYSAFYLFKFDFIIRKINIYDLKQKENAVSTSGGIFIIIFALISFSYFFINLNNFNSFKFFFINYDDQIKLSLKEVFIFVSLPSIFFLIGLFDDKYSLSANIRIFLFLIVTVFLISMDKNSSINNLNFSFYNNVIQFNEIFSIIFTSLCIISFVVALNMYDGINLQTSGYLIFLCIVFLVKDILLVFILGFIIILISFSYLNFKNKCFLGDSGIYFCASLIALILIKSEKKNILYADEVVFLLIIPMLDMFRVIILRLVRGRHPFKGDKTHLHHLIARKFNNSIVFMIILLLNLIAYLSYVLVDKIIFSLIITLFLYFSIIFYSRKKNAI